MFNPATNEVWLYYRAVTNENEIFLIRGRSPSDWSRPQLVFKGPNHTILSPTVVRRGSRDWLMWSVNGGVGCDGAATTVELRHSSDGLNWSNPIETDLKESGAFAWHLDVEWIPSLNEFWATYNIKAPGSCTTAALHFATSSDGVHWLTSPGPVLQREAIPEFKDVVYRGSLHYDAASDDVTLWYSGARNVTDRNGTGNHYEWKIGTERLTRTALFARVAQAPFAIKGVTSAPPLTNADSP